MRRLKYLAVAALMLMLAGCAGDSLEKMIPADATGVVSLDVPQILKKAGMVDGDNIVLPKSLQQVIDGNDTSPLCVLLSDLPQMGLNTDSKAYAYFSAKTFGRVLLAELDNPDKARKTLEMRIGGDFSKVEGLDCMYVGDNLYVIDGKVLLVGTVNKAMEVSRVARAARGILSKTATSILDNKEVKDLLNNRDAAINAWVQGKGLKAILGKSDVYRELSRKMPLVEIFTESDIDAVTCNIELDDDQVEMTTRILADEGSEYAQLLTSILGKPNGDVLKAIPNSMDYIFTMSVKGDSFVKLKQIQQFRQQWNAIGYVPKENRNEVNKRFNDIISVRVEKISGDNSNRQMLLYRSKIEGIAAGEDGANKLLRERNDLISKLRQAEQEATQLENNVGFFSKSANSEGLVKDIMKKIENARNHIRTINEKLDIIDSIEKEQ